MQIPPSCEDIAVLPRWAQVAFAARCARRVLPIFEKHASPDDEQRVAVRSAVELAERRAACAGASPDGIRQDAKAAQAAFNAGTTGRAAHFRAAVADDVRGAHAAYAAAHAAYAAAYAEVGNDDHTPRAAADAVEAACKADSNLDGALMIELQDLIDNTDRLDWTDNSPVPPTAFDPLDDDQEA